MIRVECSTIIPDKDVKITDKDGKDLRFIRKLELVLEVDRPNKAIVHIDRVEHTYTQSKGFFEYRDQLKRDGHQWKDDAEDILRGFIWDMLENK